MSDLEEVDQTGLFTVCMNINLLIRSARIEFIYIADGLQKDLTPLVGDVIASMKKHDTNPDNNPQAPAEFH